MLSHARTLVFAEACRIDCEYEVTPESSEVCGMRSQNIGENLRSPSRTCCGTLLPSMTFQGYLLSLATSVWSDCFPLFIAIQMKWNTTIARHPWR